MGGPVQSFSGAFYYVKCLYNIRWRSNYSRRTGETVSTEHRGGLYSYSSAVRGLRRFRMLMTGRINEKERPQVNSVRFSSSSSSSSAFYSSFSRIRCLKTNILGNCIRCMFLGWKVEIQFVLINVSCPTGRHV